MSCYCKAGAGLTGPDALHNIDKPNPVPMASGAWVSVNNKYPALVVCMGVDPGGPLVAVPDAEKNSVTEVYTSIGSGADRKLYLPVPGRWRIRNTGGVGITALVLDIPDCCAALFYGGLGGVTQVVSTPGTFTPTHVTPIDIDSGADEQVLAAGSYKSLYFRNVSPAAGIITITGNAVAAVNGTGYTLAADQTGAKNGEILVFNHPDVMPVGPFRAIASVDNQLLLIVHGS
jgi:hypothetical protein